MCSLHCLSQSYLIYFSYAFSSVLYVIVVFFFFFKQKTAYEMRISDWSSDVCSSDLIITSHGAFGYFGSAYGISFLAPLGISTDADPSAAHVGQQIGRASCRERVCQYV